MNTKYRPSDFSVEELTPRPLNVRKKTPLRKSPPLSDRRNLLALPKIVTDAIPIMLDDPNTKVASQKKPKPSISAQPKVDLRIATAAQPSTKSTFKPRAKLPEGFSKHRSDVDNLISTPSAEGPCAQPCLEAASPMIAI
jgi:hypothetical protein